MGHGDHWAAIEKDSTEFIAEMLPRICQEGSVVGKNAFTHSIDDVPNKVGIAFGLQYADTPVNFLALIVGEIEKDSNLLWSGYPVCAEGIECRLIIEEVKPWDNGIEGTIEAYVPEGGIISFFDPYFFLNKDSYVVGKEAFVKLGALAYTFQKADQLEIQITEGPMLDIHRQRLLEDDPEADVSSVTSVPISMDGAAVYFPRGESGDDAEIRFKVTATSRFNCSERPFMCISGTIMRPDSGDVNIHVYVSEQVLGGYAPQIGDNVEAVVWMQGFLIKDNKILENEIDEIPTHPENEQKCIRLAQEVRITALKQKINEYSIWKTDTPNFIEEFKFDGVTWRPDLKGKILQVTVMPLVFIMKWVLFLLTPLFVVFMAGERLIEKRKLKRQLRDAKGSLDLSYQGPEEKTLDQLWRFYGLDRTFGDKTNFQLLSNWIELLYGTEIRKRFNFEQLKSDIYRRQAEANAGYYRREPNSAHFSFVDISWSLAIEISSKLPPYSP